MQLQYTVWIVKHRIAGPLCMKIKFLITEYWSVLPVTVNKIWLDFTLSRQMPQDRPFEVMTCPSRWSSLMISRQWPEVSDFVAHFALCSIKKNTDMQITRVSPDKHNCATTCKKVWHKSYTQGNCLLPFSWRLLKCSQNSMQQCKNLPRGLFLQSQMFYPLTMTVTKWHLSLYQR